MNEQQPYRGISELDPMNLIARLEAAERYRSPVLDARSSLVEAVATSMAVSSSHQAAVRSLNTAHARLLELESGRGSVVAIAAGVTLSEFWIEMPRYSGPVRGATAEVTQYGDIHQVSDVTGTTKSGLGGAVVGGLLLGPVGALAGLAATRKSNVTTTLRTVDTRQFEIRISGPGFAWSTTGGPESGSELRELRDLVIARGSSHEDLGTVISAHRAVVAREGLAAERADVASHSASEFAVQEQRSYDVAWEQYARARLPLGLDGRARWGRAGWLVRSFAVVLGPLTLLAWLIGLAIARVAHREDIALVAGTAGAAHISALLAAVVYYVRRVRLQRAPNYV